MTGTGTWTDDDDGVFDPTTEDRTLETGTRDNRQQEDLLDDDKYFLCVLYKKTGDGGAQRSKDPRHVCTVRESSLAPQPNSRKTPRSARMSILCTITPHADG